MFCAHAGRYISGIGTFSFRGLWGGVVGGWKNIFTMKDSEELSKRKWVTLVSCAKHMLELFRAFTGHSCVSRLIPSNTNNLTILMPQCIS